MYKSSNYEAKTHFKMYKKGRQWLVAGVTVMALGLGALGVSSVSASAASAETPATSAPATTAVVSESETDQSSNAQDGTGTATDPATTPVDGQVKEVSDSSNSQQSGNNSQTPQTKAQNAAISDPSSNDDQTTPTTAEHQVTTTVKTTSGDTLSTQTGTDKIVANVNNQGVDKGIVASVDTANTKYTTVTDTIPNGYTLTGIKIETATKDNSTLTTITYDLLTQKGDILFTGLNPDTGKAETVDLADTSTPADLRAAVITTVNGIISHNGNVYTVSFAKSLGDDIALGGFTLEKLPGSAVITYIVTGQPATGGNSGETSNTGNPTPVTPTDDSTTATTPTTPNDSSTTVTAPAENKGFTEAASTKPADNSGSTAGSHTTSEKATANNPVASGSDTNSGSNNASATPAISNGTNAGTATDDSSTTQTPVTNQAKASTLPQTNEDSTSQAGALLGMSILASLAGLFGISRRRKEQQ
ncbi:KxYKxGKxW signal peptide domain-containing protein [Secundilactobacillus sp. HBUAS58055]|nr:KxYKxGKxW signal peptide domain-containing protein [Secundilactobacillus angelensis]MCH5462765.1 KxYKxGKxW signal peptide domain-containing protein [Secundilactobacillus angelensis]